MWQKLTTAHPIYSMFFHMQRLPSLYCIKQFDFFDIWVAQDSKVKPYQRCVFVNCYIWSNVSLCKACFVKCSHFYFLVDKGYNVFPAFFKSVQRDRITWGWSTAQRLQEVMQSIEWKWANVWGHWHLNYPSESLTCAGSKAMLVLSVLFSEAMWHVDIYTNT